MCHSTPYSGRGASRVLMIPKDEPTVDLDAMSRVYTWLNTSTLPNIVYRVPDSACVVVNLGHIYGSAKSLVELRELFSEFADPLGNKHNLYCVESPERARMFAAARWGWEFDAGAPLRWQQARSNVPDTVD